MPSLRYGRRRLVSRAKDQKAGHLADDSQQPTLLFIHSSNEMYGADRVTLQLIRAGLRLPNREVILLLPTDIAVVENCMTDSLATDQVRVEFADIPIMRRRYFSVRGIFRLASKYWRAFGCVRASRPEIVYMTTSACLIFAPIAWLLGVPRRILHVQEMWSGYERKILCVLGFFTSEIVCISDPTLRSLPRYLQRYAQVITNGVHDPGEPKAINLSADRPMRLLVASRWNSWKGYATLINAWGSVGLNKSLTVLGGPPPSGESTDVPALVSQLPNAEAISIVGQVEDIGAYIDQADIVIIPSDAPEPFGLVAIEAFARGRPVIASNGGGLAKIVDHGRTGWLFEMRNHRQLAQIIDELTIPEVASAGKNARASYQMDYTEAVFIDRIEKVLTKTGVHRPKREAL